MKKIVVIFLSLGMGINCIAQQTVKTGADTATVKTLQATDSVKIQRRGKHKLHVAKDTGSTAAGAIKQLYKRPISALVSLGSQGIGLEGKYGIRPNISARFGGSYIPKTTFDNAVSFGSFQSDNQLHGTFANVHLLADYIPLPKYPFLRVVGGAGYIIKGHAVMDIQPASASYHVAQTTITKEEIGTIQGDVNWKGVAPYLGLGIFKSFPGNRYNFNLDVGSYYIGSPNTSLAGTKTLVDNSQNNPQFKQNMSGYHWLPVLQVNFNYRIK